MKKLSFLFLLIILFIFSPKNLSAISGIDISEFQGIIDFNEVKNSGIQIVYIRSSASFSYIDNKFEENYTNAKNANLKIGFYHYVTARTIEEAEEQARFFASVIKDKTTDCYLAMDFEVFTGLTKEEVNAISETFLTTLENLTNKKALIYSDAYNAANVFSEDLLTKYPLWIAEYGVEKPETKYAYLGWQYSDEGRINGINDNVDLDEFKESIILDDNSPIPKPELKPEETTKTIYYRVKPGDTLYWIARRYHTTINSIVKLNHIPNPNLIYPNEVFKIITNYDYNTSSTIKDYIYIVKRGDTLTRIAHIYNVSISNLVTWNNIKNPNLIFPGQKIIIQTLNNTDLIKYTVRTPITLQSLSQIYNVSVYELKEINKNISNYLMIGDIIYLPETYLY